MTTSSPKRFEMLHLSRWAIALVLGIGLGWLIWAGGQGHRHDEAPDAPDAPAATGGAQQMYTCSMHPQVRSPNPNDKCPICAMDLIPVPADEDDDAEVGDLPRLRLTPRAAALMQIEVHPAQRRAVTMPVRLYGRLGYDETRLKTIAAWAPGRLDRLHVDFTGVTVQQGQPMVELYSPRLIAAQEELLQAIRAADELDAAGGVGVVRDTTRQTVQAARDRLRLLGLDDEQIQRVEARGRAADHVTIPAPAGGVVIERLAATGDYVDTGQPIYRLVDLSHLWVQLEVYESDVQWLAVGQPARFTTQSFPGETFEGTIAFIDPVLGDRNRTVRVRVELPNPDGRLKPGMFVRGVVEAAVARRPAVPSPDTPDAHDAHDAPDPHAGHDGHVAKDDDVADDVEDDRPLVIPASAPLITGQRAVVYVQLPDTDRPTYEPREVVLGPRAGPWYVIHDGLHEGEQVVAHGNFKIDAELQIRGRPSMMQPEGGAPPGHDHGDAGEQIQPQAASEAERAAYPLETCVVSGLGLDSMGGAVRIEYAGRTVLLCCDGCLPRFRENPHRYLNLLDEGGASQ